MLLYIFKACAFHVGITDVFILKVWSKELAELDKVANCNLMCPSGLVFVSKQRYFRATCWHAGAAVGANCYALPN
ncbi:MAG: hypothetical protein AAI978_00585 [Candidatus Hodgkinia cicadicola]